MPYPALFLTWYCVLKDKKVTPLFIVYGWKLQLFVLDLNNKRQWSKCNKKSLLWGIKKFLFCIDTAQRFNFSTQFCHFHPSMQTSMFTKLSTSGVNMMRKRECGLNVYAHLAKTVIFCNCLASFIPMQTNKGIISSCLGLVWLTVDIKTSKVDWFISNWIWLQFFLNLTSASMSELDLKEVKPTFIKLFDFLKKYN